MPEVWMHLEVLHIDFAPTMHPESCLKPNGSGLDKAMLAITDTTVTYHILG